MFIDAVFSDTWGEGSVDRVSFGCRVGPVDGQDEPAASLVEAGLAHPDSDFFGDRLTRARALEHARLAEFWELVDHVLRHDHVVAQHVYGDQ